MTSASEPPATASRRGKPSVVLGVALLLAIVAGASVWWIGHHRGVSPEETAARAELTKLGALVVMDSQREHVSSVNLATLKSPGTIDQAVQLLPALPYIKSLNADGTKLRDEHAAVIGQLTSLEDLVLSHTAITDKALESIQHLSRLKSVHLADTAITNAGMPALGRLRSLSIIDISGTKVTGNFDPLRDLAELNWLVASRLSLDAAAIAALGDCESLKRVSLNDSTCPPEALDQLAQKRPNLAIDR